MKKVLIYHGIRGFILITLFITNLIFFSLQLAGQAIGNDPYFLNFLIYIVFGLSLIEVGVNVALLIKMKKNYLAFYNDLFARGTRRDYIIEAVLFLISALGFILLIAMLLTNYSTDMLLLSLYLILSSLTSLAYPYFIVPK